MSAPAPDRERSWTVLELLRWTTGHFEGLGNAEAAHLLGIDESVASKSYLRAMSRLREQLARIPGMAEYPWR